MRTPASIARHPIHPMLVAVPIGLWVFSFVCDLLFVIGIGASLWFTLAYWTMIGGIIGAIVAAVPGFIDLLALEGQPRKIALVHMSLNIAVVVLYAVNLGMRIAGASPSGWPLALSTLAIALLGTSVWLGAHMVYVHHVAVDEDRAA